MAYSRLQNPSLLLSLLLIITTMALTNFPEVHAARSLPQISVLSNPLKPPNIAFTLKFPTSTVGINSVPLKPPTSTILVPLKPPTKGPVTAPSASLTQDEDEILVPCKPPTKGPVTGPSASLTQDENEHPPSFTEFSNDAESIHSGPEKAPAASLTQDEDEHLPPSPAVETTLLDVGVSPTSEVHGQGDLPNIAMDTFID